MSDHPTGRGGSDRCLDRHLLRLEGSVHRHHRQFLSVPALRLESGFRQLPSASRAVARGAVAFSSACWTWREAAAARISRSLVVAACAARWEAPLLLLLHRYQGQVQLVLLPRSSVERPRLLDPLRSQARRCPCWGTQPPPRLFVELPLASSPACQRWLIKASLLPPLGHGCLNMNSSSLVEPALGPSN
jgi:hypothetical protein